jgi:hypothetical protein
VSDDTAPLKEKFSQLIAWERIKRRERILLAALAYAFVIALLLLPARYLMPGAAVMYIPFAAFVLLAPVYLWRRRWRAADSLAAYAALDRALGLGERAVTAAEIVGREQQTTAERYVLHDAAEKLCAIDVKALFRREWSWRALAAPGLLALWLLLVWVGVGADFGADASKPRTVAEKVKDFSAELAEKAAAQKLAETAKIAAALKAMANERLSGKTSDEQLGQNLAAMQKRLDAMPAPSEGEFDVGGYTREELAALKAELEAAKSRLRPDPRAGDKEFLERLSSLPRAGEAMKRAGGAMENMGPGELRQLLDRLEQETAGELDRRSFADVQQFLSLLLNGGDSGDVPSDAQIPGRGARRGDADNEKSAGQGELPGEQPGTKSGASPPQQPGGGPATRVTGALGEGGGSGVTWRSEAKAAESKIPERDAPASYRKQMEEELAAEKIPPALKETVKKYFLSLDEGKK